MTSPFPAGSAGEVMTFTDHVAASHVVRRAMLRPRRRLGVLEALRHLAAALGELRHDLLVQPDVHVG
jgi:hypothetical protein